MRFVTVDTVSHCDSPWKNWAWTDVLRFPLVRSLLAGNASAIAAAIAFSPYMISTLTWRGARSLVRASSGLRYTQAQPGTWDATSRTLRPLLTSAVSEARFPRRRNQLLDWPSWVTVSESPPKAVLGHSSVATREVSVARVCTLAR